MQTIIVVLSPEKLANADLDLRYNIPDRLEEVTKGQIRDAGYDYIEREDMPPQLGIWLQTADAAAAWPQVVELFRQERLQDNDLSESAEIYISEAEEVEAEELADCQRVYPA